MKSYVFFSNNLIKQIVIILKFNLPVHLCAKASLRNRTPLWRQLHNYLVGQFDSWCANQICVNMPNAVMKTRIKRPPWGLGRCGLSLVTRRQRTSRCEERKHLKPPYQIQITNPTLPKKKEKEKASPKQEEQELALSPWDKTVATTIENRDWRSKQTFIKWMCHNKWIAGRGECGRKGPANRTKLKPSCWL